MNLFGNSLKFTSVSMIKPPFPEILHVLAGWLCTCIFTRSFGSRRRVWHGGVMRQRYGKGSNVAAEARSMLTSFHRGSVKIS